MPAANYKKAVVLARELYAAGVGATEIVERTGLPERTVMTHTSSIRKDRWLQLHKGVDHGSREFSGKSTNAGRKTAAVTQQPSQ